MTDQFKRKSPKSPEPLKWYRTSFVFILLFLKLFSTGLLLLGIVALVFAVINIRNDDWYKHRWPWFIMALLTITAIMSLLTLFIANTNPDPAIPIHQDIAPSVSVAPNMWLKADGHTAA
jgi:hypothetical protein